MRRKGRVSSPHLQPEGQTRALTLTAPAGPLHPHIAPCLGNGRGLLTGGFASLSSPPLTLFSINRVVLIK